VKRDGKTKVRKGIRNVKKETQSKCENMKYEQEGKK